MRYNPMNVGESVIRMYANNWPSTGGGGGTNMPPGTGSNVNSDTAQRGGKAHLTGGLSETEFGQDLEETITGKEASAAAKKDAENARRMQAEAMKKAAQVSEDRLKFEKEIYAENRERWDKIFGPSQDRLASFYNNLSSDDLIATGLDSQKKEFTAAREQQQRRAAQQGFTSPAVDQQTQQLDMQEAQARAGLRQQAPFQLAGAQQQFLGMGMGHQPTTAGISGAYGQQAGVYGQQAGQYGQLYGEARGRQREAEGQLGEWVGAGMKAWAMSK